jgi:hypothetical protein
MFKGGIDAVPTAKILLDASCSLGASIGEVYNLPCLRPISSLAGITSGYGYCKSGRSNSWGDPLYPLEIKVWLGDRQAVSGTSLKHIRSTTWRKTVSIDPRGPSAFVDGDSACGTAGTAELTPTDVPGAAKAMLGELALAGMSEGRDKASGASSHWCGTVDDPHMASEVAGEDEGWMIQSLIENAEVDGLRSASTT